MNDRERELAGLLALGALGDDEVTQAADDVAGAGHLADQLRIDRAVVERLEQVVARVSPRRDLVDAIVAAAQTDGEVVHAPEAAAAPVPPTRRTSRFAGRRLVPAVAMAGIAAVAIAIGLAATRTAPTEEEPFASAPLVAQGGTAIAGSAVLFDPTRPGGHVVVDLAAVPPTPPGHHYEVWVLPTGSTRMTAIGTFRSRGEAAHLDLRLPTAGRYAALDISLEDDGGPPTHSGVSVAGATFRGA